MSDMNGTSEFCWCAKDATLLFRLFVRDKRPGMVGGEVVGGAPVPCKVVTPHAMLVVSGLCV